MLAPSPWTCCPACGSATHGCLVNWLRTDFAQTGKIQEVQTLFGALIKLRSKSGGWHAQRHQSPRLKFLYYRKQKIKTKIETITTLPEHLLTEWRVYESEEDGDWITRFIG